MLQSFQWNGSSSRKKWPLHQPTLIGANWKDILYTRYPPDTESRPASQFIHQAGMFLVNQSAIKLMRPYYPDIQ